MYSEIAHWLKGGHYGHDHFDALGYSVRVQRVPETVRVRLQLHEDAPGVAVDALVKLGWYLEGGGVWTHSWLAGETSTAEIAKAIRRVEKALQNRS